MAILKAAINGTRSHADNAMVPITTAEIADAALQCSLEGADAIHFHVRDAKGHESLENTNVAAQILALRKVIPNIPIGISTGHWIEPDTNKRKNAILSWQILPDFASLNFSEECTEIIAEALLKKKINIEAGLSSVSDAERLIGTGLIGNCFRILLEPAEQDAESAFHNVQAIEKIISENVLFEGKELLLHGADRMAWNMVDYALSKGYSTRIGFEDTLYLPGGHIAESNAVLVRVAKEKKKANIISSI